MCDAADAPGATERPGFIDDRWSSLFALTRSSDDLLPLQNSPSWRALCRFARAEFVSSVREVFGNPFRPITFSPEWRTDTAVSLARTMYESRDFSAMPILADALQDAGCDNDVILNHCRDTDQLHVRGCWVVDLILGRI